MGGSSDSVHSQIGKMVDNIVPDSLRFLLCSLAWEHDFKVGVLADDYDYWSYQGHFLRLLVTSPEFLCRDMDGGNLRFLPFKQPFTAGCQENINHGQILSIDNANR